MTRVRIGRRALLALGGFGLLSPQASAKAMSKPLLEPLEVVTPKGVTKFLVEFVDTDAGRQRGLMYRTSLAPDRGMLFDFKAEQELAFWMKNTLIPLDMIYIRADGRVLSIARNAVPRSLAPVPSGGPARAVLEIPGGRAAEIGLLPGDRIRHRIFPRG